MESVCRRSQLTVTSEGLCDKERVEILPLTCANISIYCLLIPTIPNKNKKRLIILLHLYEFWNGLHHLLLFPSQHIFQHYIDLFTCLSLRDSERCNNNNDLEGLPDLCSAPVLVSLYMLETWVLGVSWIC